MIKRSHASYLRSRNFLSEFHWWPKYCKEKHEWSEFSFVWHYFITSFFGAGLCIVQIRFQYGEMTGWLSDFQGKRVTALCNQLVTTNQMISNLYTVVRDVLKMSMWLFNCDNQLLQKLWQFKLTLYISKTFSVDGIYFV